MLGGEVDLVEGGNRITPGKENTKGDAAGISSVAIKDDVLVSQFGQAVKAAAARLNVLGSGQGVRKIICGDTLPPGGCRLVGRSSRRYAGGFNGRRWNGLGRGRGDSRLPGAGGEQQQCSQQGGEQGLHKRPPRDAAPRDRILV